MFSRRLLALAPWIGALLMVLAPRSGEAVTKDVAGVVNLNTAEPALLGLLSGVGPSKARAIVSYRTRHPFRTVDELVRVKGIGRRMVRQLRSHLAVSGPSTARAVNPKPTMSPPTATLSPPAGAPPEPIRAVAGAQRPAARLVAGAPAPSRAARPQASLPLHAHANHCLRPR